MKIDVENKARLLFLFVLFIGAFAGGLWYLLSSSRYMTYQIQTREPVSGLVADAPVEFHGVDVGKVKSIELVDPRAVSILLSVRKGAPVTRATVATITSRGLATRGFTGYVYIALEDVGTDSRELVAQAGETYPVIPTTPSRSVNLDMALSQVNRNVQSLTELLQSVLDQKTVASLKQSVDSLQRISKTLAGHDEQLNSLVLNAEEASRQLNTLLKASNDTVNTLQARTLPRAHRTLSDLDSLSDSLIGLVAGINPEQASHDLTVLLQSSNDTVKALQTQVLPEAHRALSNLDNLSTSLTGFVAKINRDPSVLIRGAASPSRGPGEEK